MPTNRSHTTLSKLALQIGFDRTSGQPKPVIGGIIVRDADASRMEELLREAVEANQRKAASKREEEIVGRWAFLVRRLQVHERIQREYNS